MISCPFLSSPCSHRKHTVVPICKHTFLTFKFLLAFQSSKISLSGPFISAYSSLNLQPTTSNSLTLFCKHSSERPRSYTDHVPHRTNSLLSTVLFCIEFYCCCDKTSDKKQLRGGRIDFSLQFRETQSIVVGRHKSSQFRVYYAGKDMEAGWLVYGVSHREREKQYSSGHFLSSLYSVWALTIGDGVSHFRVHLPSSVIPAWKCYLGYIQNGVS